MPDHVAIIGCGFTGTSAFFQLVDRYPVREITILERTGDFGPGHAYRADDCRDYLLNNTTDTLCLVPGNRRAFLTWLKTRPEHAAGLDPKGHLPRSVFGEFLSAAFEATRLAAAVKGITVTLVAQEATRMTERPDGRVEIGWAGGGTVADAVLLATGRCPDTDPVGPPLPGSGTIYIPNHIRTDAFDAIAPDATVHVLGASLSAYDVVNRLFSPDTGCRFPDRGDGSLGFDPGPNDRQVVLWSRSGRLKALQSRAPMPISRRRLTPAALAARARTAGLALADVTAAILDEAADHRVALPLDALTAPFAGCDSAEAVNNRAGALLEQAIAAACDPGGGNFLVDLLSDAQVDLWDGWADRLLCPKAEADYRRSVESAFLTHFAPCPIATAQKLLALHRAGRLTIRSGVQGVSLAADGAYRIDHVFGQDRATVLVNTTGSLDRDLRSPRQPDLVRGLVAEGLLCPDDRDPTLGAAVDMASFRSRPARNIYVANMMLWGPGFFTSSAFMMALVVERLLAAMHAGPDPRAAP